MGAGLMAAAEAGSSAISAIGAYFQGQQSAHAAERMYKHRYQWQMKDMRKAGLNPMLSFSQGAPNVPQPQFQNVGEAAVEGFNKGASAVQAYRLNKAQVEVANSQKENVDQDTRLKGAQEAREIQTAKSLALDNYGKEVRVEFQSAAAGREYDVLRNKATQSAYDLSKAIAESHITENELKYQPAFLELEKQLREISLKLENAQIPEAEAAAEMWEILGGSGKLAEAVIDKLPYVGSLLQRFLPKGKKITSTWRHSERHGSSSEHTTEEYSR